MKNLFLIMFFFLNCFYLIAQNSEITALPHYSSGSLCIRLGVKNYQDFEAVKQFGFTVNRMTIIDNNDTLSLQDQQSSNVIVVNNLKPKDQSWIENEIIQSDFRDLLINGLYSTDPDTNINYSTPRLVDAVNKQKSDQGRLFAILYASEQNFDLACAAALGLIDSSAQQNKVYQYFISIKDSVGNNIINPIGLTASTFQDNIFSAVEGIKAAGKPNAIELTWLKTPETRYSGYDIFRSLDSINFTKVNDIPFVYFRTDDVLSNEVTFVDTVPPGVKYFYKVNGITPFGSHSLVSNIVSATAQFPRIKDFSINVLEPNATMTEVPLVWEVNETFNPSLIGFDVFRSDLYNGTYSKINTIPLSPQTRQFVDNNPIIIGYYYIEAIDLHNNMYASTPKMVYLPDSIPPAIPIGVVAKYFGNSKVIIKWTENTDEDLAGYRVEMSNQRNGTFVQITEKYVTTNQYDHYTDPNVVSDSIFFRVFAQDHRGNYSEKSIPNGCKRPDIVPPAKPNLAMAMASRKGIELGWSYSPTKSVIGYRLERKPADAPGWVTVVAFPDAEKGNYMPTDSTAYNFIDTTMLELRPYEYRFIAEEYGGISSASEHIIVTPLPATVTKTLISDFSLNSEIEAGKPNRIVQQQLENLARTNLNSRFSQGNNTKHHITLKWTYNLDPNVQDFQIYRAISGNNISLYRTISLAEALGLDPTTQMVEVEGDLGPTVFSIQDKDLMTGRRYTYQVVARHKDLSSTPRSIALSKKIEAN